MELFMPKRIFFEPGALDYPLGRELYDLMAARGIPCRITPSHNRVLGIPGETPQIAYREAKRTLVVGVKKHSNSIPAAPPPITVRPRNQLSGGCQYCYLATTLGRKPYVRVYVNVDGVLAAVKSYIDKNRPNITSFEAASTAWLALLSTSRLSGRPSPSSVIKRMVGSAWSLSSPTSTTSSISTIKAIPSSVSVSTRLMSLKPSKRTPLR